MNWFDVARMNAIDKQAMEAAARKRDPGWDSDPPLNRGLYYEGWIDAQAHYTQPTEGQRWYEANEAWQEEMLAEGELWMESSDPEECREAWSIRSRSQPTTSWSNTRSAPTSSSRQVEPPNLTFTLHT
jgi:hypothetical protein